MRSAAPHSGYKQKTEIRLVMTSTNRNKEVGDETELKPLAPQASTDNRDDIGRDEGPGDEERGEDATESVENVSAGGDGVRCWI